MTRRTIRPAGFRQRRRPVASTGSDSTDASRGVRLQKVLSRAGVASRRNCEKLIAEARVRVNGSLVTSMPTWVDPQRDRIEVDGMLLAGSKSSASHQDRVYVILHKPKNVICTTRDPQGRKCVLDLVDVPASLAPRIFPAGRLDADSSGLLILTNDGELANWITHPRYGVRKQYMVTIRGDLTNEDVARLKEGLYLAPREHRTSGRAVSSGRAKKASMTEVAMIGRKRDRKRGSTTKLKVTLQEGQNRHIRRMLVRLGCNVRRLQRVAIGPITLKGLACGQWRMLTRVELERLRRTVSREEGSSKTGPTR